MTKLTELKKISDKSYLMKLQEDTSEIKAMSLYECKAKGQQLSLLKKEHGMAPLHLHITLLISDINDAFNIQNKMTPRQIADTADAIIIEKWHLKDYELHKFAYMAKMGKFGKVFNQLDMSVIFDWLDQFEQLSTEEYRNKKDIEHARLKKEEITKEISEIRAIYEKMKAEPKPVTEKEQRTKDVEFRLFKQEYTKKIIEKKQEIENLVIKAFNSQENNTASELAKQFEMSEGQINAIINKYLNQDK